MPLRRQGHQIEYVNTKAAYETDFLARHPITKETQRVQISWELSDEKTFERELRGLQTAMKALSISTATIVTYDDETSLDIAFPDWVKYILDTF